jgi:exonuclease SbcC
LERLTTGRETDRKLREAARAAQALVRLEAARTEWDRKRGVLERARTAQTVVPVETFLDERLKEEKRAEASLKKAQTGLDNAQKAHARTETEWTAQQKQSEKRDQAQRQVHFLEALQDKAGRLQTLRDASDQAEKQAKSRRAALSKAEKAVKEAEVKRSNLAQTRDGARQTAGRLEALVLEEERLALVLAKRQTLVEKEKEAGEKQSAWTKCQTATRKAIGRLDALTTEYEAAENEWRSGQASLLARDLKPGQPCPVCGAEDHPRPAPPSLLVPTQADWQAVKTKVDDARRELDQARTLEAEAEREWVRVRSEADALTADLGDAAGQGLEALAALLQTKESERQTAENAARRAAEADRDLQATDADLARSRTKLETARTESGQADTAAAAALAEYKAALEDLPEALRAPGALPEALSRAVKTRDDLIRQFETTRKEFQKAETDRSAADSAFQAARSHQDEARVQREEQERALDLAVSRAGFSGREDYRAARMSHDDQESLQKDIRRFETDLAAVGEAARKAQAEAQGLVASDLEALEQTHQQAGTNHRNAVDERARLDVEQARLARLAADLERIGREFQAKEAAFSQLGRLAQVAAGDNPHNLNFQRFVLAALLDDVLDAASRRLKRMTGGRYHLERAAQGQDRRRAWGLDLDVFDGYTGHNRAVATLSGGESFLASLALALGLADVVQAYSGGLRLDAVFVDEGFGSLDAEALDLALNALMDLQAGGRMVGLISHVPEMKERIAARLEVIPTRSGSSARFVSG